MSYVETFVTGIKIESSYQSPFQGLIDQGDLLAAKIMHRGNDQAHFLPIKNLDSGHKHFNR